MKRIGIDVGGTNTDAVLIDGTAILACAKVLTTPDTIGGIRAALASIMADPACSEVEAVMIGTTHFINAVAERRDLTKVAAIRICLPACASIEPFYDWPDDLRRLVEGGYYLIGGGHELDGRPIAPFDRAALIAAAERIRVSGVQAVGITSVFSPIDPSLELEAEGILAELCPGVEVTLSHRLGRIGLLERENVTLLNAALLPLARRTVAAFVAALAESGLDAPVFLTQNDGTVTHADTAARFPVMSFASGATNSIRGAAVLSGLHDAIVIDVGGTTSDVGVLRNGFPRESHAIAEVGGVRTMFRLPDLVSLAIGGGSRVSLDPLAIGPDSVAYQLLSRARVFGGSDLTCTDLGVATGRASLGNGRRVADLPRAGVDGALAAIGEMFEEAVEQLKTDPNDVPVVAVGGGSFLIPGEMRGVCRIVHVPYGNVANAIGAASAQIAGEVDRIFQACGRDEALAQARRFAEAECVAAGADPTTVEVVEIEDIPLAYLPGDALRVRVRVVGDLVRAAVSIHRESTDRTLP
jgi:N-methylhydantoinase A/oxoprolinase/acetone carboxylase beta subunit